MWKCSRRVTIGYVVTLLVVGAGLLPTLAANGPNTFPSSGNVGVGTGAPPELFTVQSNYFPVGFRATLQSPDAASLFYGTDDSGWRFTIGKRSYNSGTYTPQLTITDGGKVGIGTTTPPELFTVQSSAFPAGFRSGLQSPDAASLFYGTDDTGWRFTIGKRSSNSGAYTPQLTITDTGKVGIGTTSPASSLHVAGNVTVDGNIGAKYQDIAEWVPTTAKLAPGVVVIVDPDRAKHIKVSDRAYDIRVVGVVSDRPGVLLGNGGMDQAKVAHSGRVIVKVDATFGAISAGDLLVTSPTPGYAMRSQPVEIGDVAIHRPGTVIGKALEPLVTGQGQILVLLTLQ